MPSRVVRSLFLLAFIATALPAYAQQTGVIVGKGGRQRRRGAAGRHRRSACRRPAGPRVTATGANGEYRLPALPPGDYTVTFTLSGMQTVTRQAQVQLRTGHDRRRGARRPGCHRGGRRSPPTRRSIDKDVGDDQERPVEHADQRRCRSARNTATCIKLIPGVQYTQDATRGPSAGGSGQDNVYSSTAST